MICNYLLSENDPTLQQLTITTNVQVQSSRMHKQEIANPLASFFPEVSTKIEHPRSTWLKSLPVQREGARQNFLLVTICNGYSKEVALVTDYFMPEFGGSLGTH